jgi:hypothetical protein
VFQILKPRLLYKKRLQQTCLIEPFSLLSPEVGDEEQLNSVTLLEAQVVWPRYPLVCSCSEPPILAACDIHRLFYFLPHQLGDGTVHPGQSKQMAQTC